jgi:phosphoglycolate phosphatase-like HAD superfamily hydrolase
MTPAERSVALIELSDAECAGVASGAPLPDAGRVVRAVRERAPVAVVSRNGVAAVRAAISALGHADLPVVARGDAEDEKPAAAPVLRACHLLDRSPAAAVVVGDTAHDVGCATAAGARSIVVRNADLEWSPPGATAYVDHLADVVDVLEQWSQ